jgi:hypothetical protein
MITVENKDVSVVRCCWYIWKEKKNEGRKKNNRRRRLWNYLGFFFPSSLHLLLVSFLFYLISFCFGIQTLIVSMKIVLRNVK